MFSFCKKKKLFPSLIIGVNGGEIDHLIGNIQIMVKYAKKNPMYFLDTYQKKNLIGIKLGIPITNQLSFTTKKGNYISIITFNKTTLSTKGLKWELSNKLLHVDGILGLRNETISNHIEITLKKGKAIIIQDISNFF
jgi:thiamine pyrophosphokinase